jgi:hypothetical protein
MAGGTTLLTTPLLELDDARLVHLPALPEFSGRIVYFCCRHCKEMFDQDPDRYRAVLERSESDVSA